MIAIIATSIGPNTCSTISINTSRLKRLVWARDSPNRRTTPVPTTTPLKSTGPLQRWPSRSTRARWDLKGDHSGRRTGTIDLSMGHGCPRSLSPQGQQTPDP